MTFSGRLVHQRKVKARPTELPAPDPRHGKDEGDPYRSLEQAPPGADYGSSGFAVTGVQTTGLVLDTPDRSHDSEGAYGTYRDQDERQMAQGPGHEGDDRGWVRQTYARPGFQDDTTRYLEDTWSGAGSHGPPPEALQRGINSLPQNNPPIEGYDGPGWRRGRRYFRFVDRKHKLDHRVYTAQQLLARQIMVPTNQAAQNGEWGRTSPFQSLARNLDTITQSPELFRSPPSLTESVLADQEPTSGDDGGIATDGMWAVT